MRFIQRGKRLSWRGVGSLNCDYHDNVNNCVSEERPMSIILALDPFYFLYKKNCGGRMTRVIKQHEPSGHAVLFTSGLNHSGGKSVTNEYNYRLFVYIVSEKVDYLLIAWGLLTESSKRICLESCFFYHPAVSLYCTYILCTGGRHNISLIEDLVRLRAQKHKPTMASAASPRAANPKMVESPASMMHASSSYACTEDGYFKRPHTVSIDGGIWLDSGCFFVGFEGWWTFDTQLARQKL